MAKLVDLCGKAKARAMPFCDYGPFLNSSSLFFTFFGGVAISITLILVIALLCFEEKVLCSVMALHALANL